MRSLFSLAFPILLISPPTLAALATDASSALSFYRSKDSSFPSGQASRTILENKLVRTQSEASYGVRWDKKTFDLQGSQILRDIQVARMVDTKSGCQLLSLNRADSSVVKTLNDKTTVEIIDADHYWARVKTSDQTQGWVPLSFLQNRHDDTGVYVNIIDTFIRQRPSSFAPVITTLPRLKRILPLAYEKGFLKIQYNNSVGYVDINHFVSRADFANLAYVQDKNWIPVTFRNGAKIISAQREEIELQKVLGFVTSPLRGIVIRPSTSWGPQLMSRVEIIKPEAEIWAVSRLDGHGEVWWKRTPTAIERTPAATSMTTEDLLKKEIYSIAFESKTSVRGIVSSEGIYRTDDGLNWTPIPQFGKQNYPVYIHPNGTWFVGSYKSINNGKSFEPFIRWDKIAEAIEGAFHKNPKLLRLTQIDALPNSQVLIYVDTGSSKIKLRSSLDNSHWTVIAR